MPPFTERQESADRHNGGELQANGSNGLPASRASRLFEPMAETVDELTIQYEEDGKVLRKQLDKEVLSKGSWTTIMFLYQDLDRKSGEYGPHKVSIRRYQKRDGSYLPRSKFEISSPRQALAIRDKIGNWFPED